MTNDTNRPTVTVAGMELDEASYLLGDLFSPAGRADPYPRYARLREIAPVFLYPDGVMLTRYEDCQAVLRDTSTFLVADAELRAAAGVGEAPHASSKLFADSMLGRNQPAHTRLRKLVSSAFTPRRVAELEPQISALISDLVDTMAEAGSDGSPVDLHELLALPLPVSVISTLLGVPDSDWPWMRALLSDLSAVLDVYTDEARMNRADAAYLGLRPYLRDLVAERAARPRDDLLTALAGAHDPSLGAAEQLTEDEVVTTAMLLFIAGYETTVNLITNGTVALLRHPDALRGLRADYSRTPAYVEEMLRYDAPVQGTSRATAAETMIGGVRVPAFTEVMIYIGAANRDPARFPDPDRFDPTRADTKVMSFGAGIHFCLGAPLARLEAGLAFPAMLDRFPSLELASEPVRRESFNLRGFDSVPLTVR
jgi:cytochrome P450